MPAVVLGDRVTGVCTGHQMIGPVGSPIPAPPMPFMADLVLGTCATVLVGGKPVAVVGSSGYNLPPHVGLHASDPKMVPLLQEAKITVGSSTVTAGGAGVAHTGCTATACITASPTVVGTASTVLVGS